KTLTRTIKVTTPDGKTTTISQVAKLTRTAEVDEVTGEVVKYSDWTTGTWGAFTPKEVEGYTPTPEAVAQQAVTADVGDQAVVVTYTADAQTIEVRYVDDDDHEKLVHTNTVTGKSGQTVKITPAAPAGYELVDATPITYQVTAQPNQVVTVHVKHQTSTTSESKTLTRTIELHTPFDGVKLIKQVAELTRLVTFGKATGQSTTGAWSTGQWDAYQVPTYAGYAPTIDVVPAVNLTGADKDQTVVVNYQALQHTTHVNYVDENGTLVHTTTLSGKTNEVVTVPTKVTPTKPRAKVVATGKTNEVVTVPTKVTPTKPQAKVAATGKPVVASRAAAPAQPTPATEQRLPQTGNQATATGQIWGLLAASLATGLGLWHTKKKK